MTVSKLVCEQLIPIAYKGLKQYGIDDEDANKLLTIVEKRARGMTGAEWQIRSFRNLKKKMKPIQKTKRKGKI